MDDIRETPPPAPIGAGRFRDGRGRVRGWASTVSLRPRGLSRLTVLDVTTEDPALAMYLRTLDGERLLVDSTADGVTYKFSWASGYENGGRIRVQGAVDTMSGRVRDDSGR